VKLIRLVSAGICVVALASGCFGKTQAPKSSASSSGASSASSSASSSAASPAQTSSSAQSGPAQASPPDAQGCVDITSARLDLIVASTSDQARPAADTLEKWSPPDKVKDAIEHLVDAGGGQINDPGFNDANSAIEDWVKEICPT
jgi:hypothetical protein